MPHRFNRVSVIGLGYIGCPTAVMLASHGVRVIGVDINSRAVESVNRGEPHIVESGLGGLMKSAVSSGRLSATTKPEPADVFVIAVPTPVGPGHKPDLSYVEAACASISTVLQKGNLVILESTSPVGTTEHVAGILAEKRPELTFPHQAAETADVQIAYCPERVLPGKILDELITNQRVIGGITCLCAERAADLYRIFTKGACHLTDARTAEMIKLAENAYRDVNIAFANELSLICDELKIDPWNVIELANLHPRVNILQPGPGVGGHCIAVDPWFIIHSAPDKARIIAAAREVNELKMEAVISRVLDLLKTKPTATIACLGLSFKADIDDFRESPAVKIVQALQQQTLCHLLLVEPYMRFLPESLLDSGRTHLASTHEALEKAEIVLVLVNHKEFFSIQPAQIAGKTVIDTRGLFRGMLRSETSIDSRGQRSRPASAGAAR